MTMELLDTKKMTLEEKENEIKRRVHAKGWEDNVVSRYLLHSRQSPCAMASLMGVNRVVVSRWVHLHDDDLTPFTHWVFFMLLKLRLHGVSVEDYF